MIPLLFSANETQFNTFGLGALADTISCEITEERNGKYELILKYPVNSSMFSSLATERIIFAKPNDKANNQAFRIYRISTPLNGVVSVYAQHISYDLCNIGETMWSDASISPSLALNILFINTTSNHDFTGTSAFSEPKAFSVKKPKSVRSCLGGSEGSFLDIWGGEFSWDNFTVHHYVNRGRDTGVVIEYGKNLTDLTHENDNSDIYTDILPYAVYTDDEQTEHVITLTPPLISITGSELAHGKTLIKDFTDFFESGNEITQEELRGVANSYISQNPLGAVTPNITVSFEPLWKQPEYAAVLEKVSLCDTVKIRHSLYGIETTAKVITTVYDSLNEKYVSITLGTAKSNFINEISEVKESITETEKKIDRFPSLMNTAIKNATDKITGQNGGYVVINQDSNGKPYELLIMDSPSTDTAENVWRWNLSGLGFSSTGYDGTYTTAITSDGEIVADFITSGTLIANIIKAGVLSSLDGSSWWDLESGEVHLSSYASTAEVESVSMTVDRVQTEVTQITEKSSEIQASVDGLTSYVSSLTGAIETVSSETEDTKESVLSMQSQMSALEQSVSGLSVKVTNGYVGGINLVQNSAGLNGITDDWIYTGTVSTDTSTDVLNNTTSDSAFVLGTNSTLTQTITGLVTGTSYVLSLRAKKTASSYQSYVRITYNGSKTAYAFSTTNTFEWTEYSLLLDDVQDGSIEIYIFNRYAYLYVSDIMLAEGTNVHKWTPAPNEIYTSEVKIDKRGIEVSNSASSQKTVITNTEFAGYYNDEVIFTLNKDETQTKKTTVDGELTVGRTKFVPMSTASDGLNIVILD